LTIQIDDAGFEFPNEISKWIWIAGIIDAESSLELQKSKGKTARQFRFIPRMACSSTTLSLLFQLKRTCFPYGNISSHHYQDKRDSQWSRTNKFMVFGDGLRIILPKLLPYLVVKRNQALLLTEALSLLTKGRKPKEIEGRLVEIWLQMRELNRRGRK